MSNSIQLSAAEMRQLIHTSHSCRVQFFELILPCMSVSGKMLLCNHKTELIDFNRRILNHKLLTGTERTGWPRLNKHNEYITCPSSNMAVLSCNRARFLTVSAHVPNAHRRLIGLRSKLLVTRFHILGAGA